MQWSHVNMGIEVDASDNRSWRCGAHRAEPMAVRLIVATAENQGDSASRAHGGDRSSERLLPRIDIVACACDITRITQRVRCWCWQIRAGRTQNIGAFSGSDAAEVCADTCITRVPDDDDGLPPGATRWERPPRPNHLVPALRGRVGSVISSAPCPGHCG